jgi:hypothetical protein
MSKIKFLLDEFFSAPTFVTCPTRINISSHLQRKIVVEWEGIFQLNDTFTGVIKSKNIRSVPHVSACSQAITRPTTLQIYTQVINAALCPMVRKKLRFIYNYSIILTFLIFRRNVSKFCRLSSLLCPFY